MSINSTSTEKQKFQSRYSTLIHLENRGLTIFKFQKKAHRVHVCGRGNGMLGVAEN